VKRQVNKSEFSFLSKELGYYESNGLVAGDQKNQILELYEVQGGLNFIRVVLTIGAILVGLGILSFIASNWAGIGKLTKLVIIFGVFLGVNIAGYRLAVNYPKTGRSFLYLGTLVYGAGIFLIGQMFNLGGNFAIAFLLWALGIVPLALQQKDKYLMLFANLLFVVYLNGSLQQGFPYAALVGVPALYLAYNYFDRSRLLLFFANFTALNFILYLTLRYEVKAIYIAALFFLLGLLMYFLRHKLPQNTSRIFEYQGNLIFGAAGVVLTMPEVWRGLISSSSTQVTVSVAFAIVFVAFLFLLIRKGSLVSLGLVCIVIFRYYVDTIAFLPKSLFFVVGGLLLLGFGYYFEHMRKSRKGGREA